MASSWIDVWGTEANEDGLGEGFVSGVWEDGHGLSLMFQAWSFVFIADFSAAEPSHLHARIIEIIWQIYCVRLVMVISPLRITQFPQSTIKECIERRLNRVVIMTIPWR